MGKDKEKQKSFRSRQQPASSSQAAALLSSQPGEFIGFSAFSPMLELEQHLPGEYSVCFKKMNKKDTTTKVKAMAEFVQLLTNAPPTTTGEHKILLQNWVSAYTKLSTDAARQVREAAQQGMGKVATTVKKQLGPHLKTLLPYWLAARFDSSREVSRSAIDALQHAIPPHKHAEALKFVGRDILTQYKESFAQNPQTFSDAKTSPEAAQERYERVISTFMMAISYLTETLTPEDNAAFAEQYKAIFFDVSFWKFLTSKSPAIRRAAYNLVPVVCRLSKQIPELDVTTLLSKDVLGLFSDKDPTTHQAMWDAVLSFATTFPQAWELPSVDIKKHVFPRLFAFLRAGAYGSLSYPSLLPFLSVVPSSLRNASFYSQFFGNMWQGLSSEGITKNGRPAAQSLIVGYLECISFAASSNNSSNNDDKPETETYIFREGVWLVLQHYLTEESLVYGDEFFVESFCKYTQKLFLASSADGRQTFWKKFEDVFATVLYSSPAIFCARLASLLSAFEKTAISVPAEIQRALFEKVVDRGSPSVVSHYHLTLATALVKLWPLTTLVSDADSFWTTNLLASLNTWLHTTEVQAVIFDLLNLLAAFLVKTEKPTSNWDALLGLFVSSDSFEYLLFVLEKITENGDNSKWLNSRLDSLVRPLLPGGNLHARIPPQDSSRILQVLISSHGAPVIEKKTLQELGSGLTVYLASKPPAYPRPWGLDVIKTLVAGSPDNGALVSDLLVEFLSYVLHARDDGVLAAWQDCMHIGKKLDETQAFQIRQQLLDRLRGHVVNDSQCRFHPELGFTPDADAWIEELVVCQAVAQEIVADFPNKGDALGVLVHKDEWIAASVAVAGALSPNYVDTRVSPILPLAHQPATDIEPFLKLSLFNLAFIRGAGELMQGDADLWATAQLECVRLVSHADLIDAAPAWWEAAQRLRDAAADAHDGALLARGDDVLERGIELARNVGGIYVFVLEKVALRLANSWDKEKGLEILARFILPLEKEALETDDGLGRFQAILPQVIPQIENPNPALTELRAKYIQLLQESTEFKRTTRILEALSCLITTAFPLSLSEMQSIFNFFSRFSRVPLKSHDPGFSGKRLDIALCRILVSIVRTPEFLDVSVEFWKLLKIKSIEWLKVTTSDPISVLLHYQATKLYSDLDSTFTLHAEKETVKELDWATARAEAQQAVVIQLVNARKALTTQASNRLYTLLAHVFHSLPANLIEPHISKLYGLFYHENTDIQKWSHFHLSLHVTTPIPEARVPTLADEHQKILRDTSVWDYVFEEEDAPVVRLITNRTITLASVFGHLLAWDVLVQFLSTNNTQVRSQISAQFLREGFPSPVSVLLQNIFKYIHLYSAKGKNKTYGPSVHHFHISDQVSISGRVIGVFSGALYLRLLQCVPGVVRLWWTDDCEKKMGPFVDTYTTTHVSPTIIDKELALASKHGSKGDSDFSVFTISRSREVVATYRKDEMVVEIVLTLSPNYPLRACSVAVNQHLNVGEGLWRKWLLGMTTLLLTSEGDLLDACLLWKNSLDQHFEGVEVCPICYSLFNSGQIPRLQCRTCKNKFHSTCMYKWFSTSHKSTCPLCQTDFQSL